MMGRCRGTRLERKKRYNKEIRYKATERAKFNPEKVAIM
jgi:hypothetical protein